MNRNRIIDMSQAHLIPERVREYAPRVFDVVKDFPAPDRDAQIFYILVSIIENCLKAEPSDSPLFEKTNALPEGKAGLEALHRGKKDWLNDRYPRPYASIGEKPPLSNSVFPYFSTYAYDNDLTQPDAVRSLMKYYGIKIPCAVPDTVSIPGGNIYDDSPKGLPYGGADFPHFHTRTLPGNRTVETTDLRSHGFFALYGADLLAEDADGGHSRPVFVTESFYAAAILEAEVWHNHILTLAKMLADDLKVGFPEDAFDDPLYRIVPKEKPEKAADLIFNLLNALRPKTYNSNYPLGDVIWVSPLGGYSIPWWNDFSVLEGRDIYIFKMNFPDRRAALQELLDVYSCLPPHDEVKVRFVLLPRKISSLANQNPTEFLDIGGIFDRCDIDGVPIPEHLLGEYDRHLRNSGKKRTSSQFIVTPFLRQNSWALLTGEEGVGKSYIALALGMAIAAKGTLFGNWKVCHRSNKVLYIADDEMSDDILAERLRGLRRMYRHSENFILQSVHAMDLLNGGMETVNSMIAQTTQMGEQGKPVNVLILDHLLKLSATKGDQYESWPTIRSWIEDLNRSGISVLLLHHEYGGTRMLGSRLIANDAPARVHLERKADPAPDHLTIGVSIPKNRGGKDQRTAETVTLVIGKTPHWKTDDAAERSWKSLSPDERTQMINAARQNGKTVQEIAHTFSVSKSTIEKWIFNNINNHKEKI